MNAVEDLLVGVCMGIAIATVFKLSARDPKIRACAASMQRGGIEEP